MFRTILFAFFAASAAAFSVNPAFLRPTTSLRMAKGEGYSHGLDNTKTKHDMDHTSSTDSQDENREVNDPASVAEKAEHAVEEAAEEVKERVTGDN